MGLFDGRALTPGDVRDAADGVAVVWEAWRDRQRHPDRCVLSDARRRRITSALRAHPAQHVVALIRFAYEANHPDAEWWRGDNPRGREYLGLDNLLQSGKLDDRIETALAYYDNEPEAVVDGVFARIPDLGRSRSQSVGYAGGPRFGEE